MCTLHVNYKQSNLIGCATFQSLGQLTRYTQCYQTPFHMCWVMRLHCTHSCKGGGTAKKYLCVCLV